MKYLQLLRIKHWFKNLLIFAPLIFSGQIPNKEIIGTLIIGFFCLSFVSSAGYIFNDIIDRNKDKYHEEKKNRPIASGKISITKALIIMAVLIIISFIVSYSMSSLFGMYCMFLLFSLILYSSLLKHIFTIDLISISINYVLRAASGAALVGVWVSPWLVLCSFFLAMFVLTGKRKGDLTLLGENKHKHKPVMKYYTKKRTDLIATINMAILLSLYTTYSIRAIYDYMPISTIIVYFAVFRYYVFIKNSDKIIRKPELIFKDKIMDLLMVGYLGILYVIIHII